MYLHPALKDKTLHLILISAIVILAGTTIYFRYFFKVISPLDQAFLDTYGSFNKELALQSMPETVEPGALRVPILTYHSISPHTDAQSPLQRFYDVAPDSFIREMQYLKDAGYVVISLDFLVRALDQNITLPPKSVILTFDDGWQNQYSYAFPILKKYGFTATFFIYTNAIGHDYFLTWDQVRVLNDSGMTIGGHTESHTYLLSIHDENRLRKEIIGGKGIIEDQIHQKIYLFAYPYGDYNDNIIKVVKDAGYIAARSAHAGVSNTKADIYKLKAVDVTDDFDAFVQDLNY